MLVQYVPKKIEKRALIIFTSAITCLAFLCAGPSEILHFPDNLVIMILGQALFGISYAVVMVPSLPEMIESALEIHPQFETQINTMCPGVFSACLGLGQVIGPIAGSTLDEIVGFQHTMTILAAMNLAFALAYFICVDGSTSFKKTYQNYT